MYSISRDVGGRSASSWGSSITNEITSLINIAAPACNETSTPSVQFNVTAAISSQQQRKEEKQFQFQIVIYFALKVDKMYKCGTNQIQQNCANMSWNSSFGVHLSICPTLLPFLLPFCSIAGRALQTMNDDDIVYFIPDFIQWDLNAHVELFISDNFHGKLCMSGILSTYAGKTLFSIVNRIINQVKLLWQFTVNVSI